MTAARQDKPHVEQLDPMGYTDEEFYRAKCADLENEVKGLRGVVNLVRELEQTWTHVGSFDHRHEGPSVRCLRCEIRQALGVEK